MSQEPDHVVVVNEDEQYSIWPSGRPVPPGWTTVGQPGGRAECLERVAGLWVDMRPKSLRQPADDTDQKDGNG